MSLTSDDCKKYIANWVKMNPTLLTVCPFHLKDREEDIRKGRRPYKTEGTDPKNWKRVAKKIENGVIYRAFTCVETIYELGTIIVLQEENSTITKLEYGTYEDFEGAQKLFKKIN